MLLQPFISVQKHPPLLFAGLVIISIFLLTVSCSTNKSVESPKSKEAEIVSIDKKLLLGIWGTAPNENASFQVLQDTIYYVDADRRLTYKISGNLFICFDEKGDTNYICSVSKLDKDSLVMENKADNAKSVFIRLH